MAILQRERDRQGAAQGLRGQQDQGRRVVRLELRSPEWATRLRQRASEIHSGTNTIKRILPQHNGRKIRARF